MNDQPKLVFNSDSGGSASGYVCVQNLPPDLVSLLQGRAQSRALLRLVLRVRIVRPESAGEEDLPDVFGRYQVLENELQFAPYFPFERNVEYLAVFDPRPLGGPFTVEPFNLEFSIPSEQKAVAPTEVTHVFPSSGFLPENLLRFYVFFSNPMLRGPASEEIALLDSDGQPVADALYRAPVELWDRSMRCLTVLMDPGRLKRWVGPNVELGSPLKVGQEYILEIGSRMVDLHGRPLRERFRKGFLAGDPVREPISVENWKILPPATGSRQALVLMFPSPLDRALLFWAITIESEDGLRIDGRVEIDQSETRWSFTPTSPWIAGPYRVRVEPSLEDVCGNTITGAFDRPLRKDSGSVTKKSGSPPVFQLM